MHRFIIRYVTELSPFCCEFTRLYIHACTFFRQCEVKALLSKNMSSFLFRQTPKATFGMQMCNYVRMLWQYKDRSFPNNNGGTARVLLLSFRLCFSRRDAEGTTAQLPSTVLRLPLVLLSQSNITNRTMASDWLLNIKQITLTLLGCRHWKFVRLYASLRRRVDLSAARASREPAVYALAVLWSHTPIGLRSVTWPN